MSSQQHDGGPVFPATTKLGDASHSAGGMSLRDYFAGQALTATINLFPSESYDEAAKEAWRYADAMLRYQSGIPIDPSDQPPVDPPAAS